MALVMANDGCYFTMVGAHELQDSSSCPVRPVLEKVASYIVAQPREAEFGLNDLTSSDADALLLATGRWASESHKECWVFDSSQCFKSKALWQSMRGVERTDMILPASIKAAINRDVYGLLNDRSLERALHNLPFAADCQIRTAPGWKKGRAYQRPSQGRWRTNQRSQAPIRERVARLSACI